jgi:hypothetical protein
MEIFQMNETKEILKLYARYHHRLDPGSKRKKML